MELCRCPNPDFGPRASALFVICRSVLAADECARPECVRRGEGEVRWGGGQMESSGAWLELLLINFITIRAGFREVHSVRGAG